MPSTLSWRADVEKLSFQAKKAYFAKHRRSNFAASLRLEGFTTSKNDDHKLPTREAALVAVRQIKA
nr:YhfG family protein [Pseudomonas proteolytica]